MQASPPAPALLDRFASYEDYLGSLLTPDDLLYLPDRAATLQLAEWGPARGEGAVLRREEWAAAKAALAAERHAAAHPAPPQLLSAGRELGAHPLLRALADRELPVRRGSLATILFLRDRNARGQEVSGYIDVGHRLAADPAGMAAVWALEARLLPRAGDLSCLNWASGKLDSAASPNFEVVADPSLGLAFKGQRDRKMIVVDPAAASPGDYTSRIELETSEYAQAVLFDHIISRRT